MGSSALYMVLSCDLSWLTNSWYCSSRISTARTSFMAFFSGCVKVCGIGQVASVSAGSCEPPVFGGGTWPLGPWFMPGFCWLLAQGPCCCCCCGCCCGCCCCCCGLLPQGCCCWLLPH